MIALVTGATGLIGSHIVDKLVKAGVEVRTLVRLTRDISHLRSLDVDGRVGDITDCESRTGKPSHGEMGQT